MNFERNFFSRAKLDWLQLILYERFGIRFSIYSCIDKHKENLHLILNGEERYIVFDSLLSSFHDTNSNFSCGTWDAKNENYFYEIEETLPLPGLDSLGFSSLVEETEFGYIVHYDILGFIFWNLNRLEEFEFKELDNHKRFPAVSSHAFEHGYLERPIVDEWLGILRQIILKVWPHLELKCSRFEIKVSHDVDAPAKYAFHSLSGLARTMAGDVLIRKNFKSVFDAPFIWLNSRANLHDRDPYNTFDWLMDQSERNNLVSAFYFICGHTDPKRDGLYDIGMPQIRKLMKNIHLRGHEIGLHPSYNTYEAPSELLKEFNMLKKICSEENIEQRAWGGRMHYLRWNHPVTLKACDNACLCYDTSLGYADLPGFRCGTCFEYPAFDVISEKILSIRVRPLIAMECSVISERYLGLGSTDLAYNKFDDLKQKCKKVRGCFTLLWHNSFFQTNKNFEIYRRLISVNT